MVTGASLADLAIVLVDARKGVIEQSRRHAFLATLLGIRHLVLCVNKMDLVDFSEEVFDSIAREFEAFVEAIDSSHEVEVTPIPVSALNGDNVVDVSPNLSWYAGPPLLEHLEKVDVHDHDPVEGRFPVQYVIRPMSDEHHDYRGYAGQVAGGTFHPGDEVVVLPSGLRTRVAAIDTLEGEVTEAFAPMAVTLRLTDEIDVSRGDLLAPVGQEPRVTNELEADICWMIDKPLAAGSKYSIKHTTRMAKAVVTELVHRLDVNTLEQDEEPTELGLNGIGRVRLRVSSPLAVDAYAVNRITGSFILVDDATNATAGAGLIRG
jgi:bifunctional enzyme CysN/CysC